LAAHISELEDMRSDSTSCHDQEQEQQAHHQEQQDGAVPRSNLHCFIYIFLRQLFGGTLRNIPKAINDDNLASDLHFQINIHL